MLDAIVVGAGPAGCATATRLAAQGKKVLVLEEHSEIGKPVQCAGIVSWRIKELLPDLPEEVILNRVTSADFHFGDKTFNFPTKELFYILDRCKFDKFLADKAEKAGAEIRLNTQFLDFDGKTVKTSKGDFETKMLVGADGPFSRVAKVARIERPKLIWVCMQATVEGDFKKDVCELWYGKKIAQKGYGWVVPLDEKTARMGVGSKKNVKECFDHFCKLRLGKTVKHDVSGPIRIGLQEQSVKGNIQLIGDAATMVKPFSGGGILFSLIAAKYCGDEDYEKKWRKELEGPIKRGMRLYKMLMSTPEFIRPFLVEKFKPRIEKLDADFIESI